MDRDTSLKIDLRKIKAVVFDFDGVFTDNRVFVFQDGFEAVVCSRADGLGIGRLRRLSIEMLIVSTETNPIVTQRARKLNLPVIQSVEDKLLVLSAWAKEKKILMDHVAFLGNDINDQTCLETVGMPVVVADAMPEVAHLARVILKKDGGKGAVREFCDMLWQAKQKG